jgi:hypothetical protein
MTTDTLRQVFGTLRTPNGSPFPNKSLKWFRERRTTVAQGSSVVLDDPFIVTTDAEGDINTAVMAGSYLVMAPLADADRYFRVVVPDQVGPFDISSLIDGPIIEPDDLTQFEALVAKAKAWANAPENSMVEGGEFSAKHYATKAVTALDSALADAAQEVLNAQLARAGAESAEIGAQAARDAAFVNADVFVDTAAGLAGTSEGYQFLVVEGDEIVRYSHDTGPVATEVARYPSASVVDEKASGTFVSNFAAMLQREDRTNEARAVRSSVSPEEWASDRLVTMFRSHGGNEANRVHYLNTVGAFATSGTVARVRGAGADLVSNGLGATTLSSRAEALPDPVTGIGITGISHLRLNTGGVFAISADGDFDDRVLNVSRCAIVAKLSPLCSNGQDVPIVSSATGEIGITRASNSQYRAYVQKTVGADTIRWETGDLSPNPSSASIRPVIAISFDGFALPSGKVSGRYEGDEIAFSLVQQYNSVNPSGLFDSGESLAIGSDDTGNTKQLDLFTLALWADPEIEELRYASEWASDVDRKTFLNNKRDRLFIPIETYGPNGQPAANRVITRSGTASAGTAAYIGPDPDALLTIVDGDLPTIAAPADPNVSPWTTALDDDLPYAWTASGRWVQDYRYPGDTTRMVMVTGSARITGRDGSGNATGLERYAGLFKSSDGGLNATPVAVASDGGTPYHAFEAGVAAGAVNNLVLPGRTFVQWVEYLPEPQNMWLENEWNAAAWVDVRYVVMTEVLDGSGIRAGLLVCDQIEDPSRWFKVPVEIVPSGFARSDREFGNQTGTFNPEMVDGFWELKCITWNRYDGYFYAVIRPNGLGWSGLNGGQREVRQHWICRAAHPGINGLRRWDTQTAMPLTPRPNWAYHSYIVSIVDVGEGCFAMVSSDYLSPHLNGTTSALVEPTGDASRHNKSQFSIWTCSALGQEYFRLVNPLIVDTPSSDWCSGFLHQGYVEPNNGRLFWWGLNGQHGGGSYIGPQDYRGGAVSINMATLRGLAGRGAKPNMVADPEGTVVVRQSLPFYAGDYDFLQLVAETAPMGSARVRLIDPETRETIPGYGYAGAGFVDGGVYDWRAVWDFEPRTKVRKAARWALPDRMVIAEIETRSVTGMGATKIAGLYARRFRSVK